MAITRREFDTIEDAQTFINAINLQLGIPSSEDATAKSYTDYIEENGFFYVEFDDAIINFER